MPVISLPGFVAFLSILHIYFMYMMKQVILLLGISICMFACGTGKRNNQTENLNADSITNTAKPGWQVFVNKQLILQSNTEDPAANSKTVKANDLFTGNGLQITYTEEPDAKLNRSYIIMDNNRHELFRTENTKQPINGAELKKAIGDQNTIVLYTVAIPSDPALAATVRVRPVHLCTLILQ